MRAEDLRLEEILQFAEGKIELRGRRLVLHSIDAFARFREALIEKVGLQEARKILTRFGFFWGEADASAMERIFRWDDVAELLLAGPRLHTLQGVARNQIKRLEFDEERKTLRCELTWYGSGEAEEHLKVFGKSDHPVCWMLSGYASGYFSAAFGTKIYFTEEKCRAQGDRFCSAVGLDERSWGGDLAKVSRYYRVDDIAGQIRELRREIKRKDRELHRQRELLNGFEIPGGEFAEVRSKSFREVLDLVGRVAAYDSTVLILGETGVGKEVIARHVHRLSKRAKEPFLAVNCSALPETLLESELFGHRAGAFTGASENRIGLFESADRGTLFLDEIGDIPVATQIKLLRVLESREITRIGESSPRRIDVRIVAATNRNLEEAVRVGEFREDLYFRLGVIRLEVPPLRDRTEDILPLARFFVEHFAQRLGMPTLRLDPDCFEHLLRYRWPGNIRELENAIERAAVLSQNGLIRARDLPSSVSQSISPPTSQSRFATLAEAERAHVAAALEATGGNRARAARLLAISPTTLWRKLKAWGPDSAPGDSSGQTGSGADR